MGRLAGLVLGLWSVVTFLAADAAQAYNMEGRWSRTATDTSTGAQGTPVTLTWSIAPDGTLIAGNTSGTTIASSLVSFLDTNLGAGPGGADFTQRPWFPMFEQSFARLGTLAGVTYIYEPNDDGRAFGNSSAARGQLGVRGDVRIGAKPYEEGSSVLASNYYPDYGEMMINTNQASYYRESANNRRMPRNILMHEALHGIGVRHVESDAAGFLMEPFISTAFDGPQLDDLLSMQRLYGDVLEKGGGNDVFGRATSLGTVTPTTSQVRGTLGNSTVITSAQVDFLSIDDNSDTDFFSFSIGSPLEVSLQLTPRGATYQVGPQGGTQSSFNAQQLSDLTLDLYDTNGTSVLESANLTAAGGSESITRQLIPGTYFARVKGLDDDIQLYQLGISAIDTQPRNLVWTGVVSSVWNSSQTTNFTAAGEAMRFNSGDNVRFDDTAVTKQVTLTGELEAGEVVVDTAGEYVFAGSGSLIEGNLTVTGGGTVELANAGNSYEGPTTVAAGTLAITGNANAMRTTFMVEAGATLLVDASDAAESTSSFVIRSGGTLQIGTTESSGNVFPDIPTSFVNDGTVRMLATETLQHVDGAGRIEVGGGMTTLLANPGFSGDVSVAAGGIVLVTDPHALGTSETTVEVQSDGQLEFVGEAVVTQEIRLSAAANLVLSPETEFAAEASLSGEGWISGVLAMPGTISPGNPETATGTLRVLDDLSLAETSQLEFHVGAGELGAESTSLMIDGSAILGGTLSVALAGDFAPALYEHFELLTARAGLSGEFAALDLPELSSGLRWDVVYGEESLSLMIAADATALPGDFNLDGIVDAADYSVWRDGLGTVYNLGDYQDWKSNFGQRTASGGVSPTAVPEPAGLAVVLLATAFLVARRTTFCSARAQ
jgi:autotransporter-associated beta strand protein